MADYKELLRRAISALPENNGAARRAVYEKARTALVGQLRAIDPPLAARDITQHRLQLEDCIRQVEQEASEAVISLGREREQSAPAPRPTISAAAGARPAPAAPTLTPPATITSLVPPEAVPVTGATLAAATPPDRPVSPIAPRPEARLDAAPRVEPAAPAVPGNPAPAEASHPTSLAPPSVTDVVSIEDIIAQAEDAPQADVAIAPTVPTPSPTPVAPVVTRIEAGPRSSGFLTPREARTGLAASAAGNVAVAQRLDAQPTALEHANAVVAPVSASPVPVEAALSSVREVELEEDEDTREAQGAIERAIETLDREARGEPTSPLPDRPQTSGPRPAAETSRADEQAFSGPRQRRGAGLTIFLTVFALLLAGAGGAGYWAVHEGYIDLDQMFGRSQTVETAQAPAPVADPATPTMDTAAQSAATGTETDAAGPGNTATSSTTEPTTALQGLEVEDRLEPTPTPVEPTGTETVLPSLDTGEAKSEERLSNEDTSIAATPAADDPGASVDPAVLAGNQSLLLEASTDGRSSAVPFSGTVEWTEGVDEIGLPTLIAQASIPARNLGVTVTIRKNSDPSLPASHLMEVNFNVPDTFLGGSISSLPGVLLKNEELVPGTPLAGASARVVGNSFLFALSAAEDDAVNNLNLLRTRRWLDLAIVYGTGRNAILTLEKDQETQDLFEKVFTAWAG